MATITVNQFNDDGTTARTAGEVLTINGGILTQRTDTRWHATAPASMTGTYGGSAVISTTLGGGLVIDGTKVRWLSFNSGSGNVPAIGTMVSQSGVSGYLLGVYPNLLSAPSTVGSAMPVTGSLKFREVTGTFSLGGLGGLSNTTASGADVTGWLEVVCDSSFNLSVPRLGYFKTTGSWFYLDNTTGTRGQLLQVPTNGGGVNTFVPGVWIESNITASISSASFNNDKIIYNTSTAHRFKDQQVIMISGVTPSDYNTEQTITLISTSSFSVPRSTSPGLYSANGTASFFEPYPSLTKTTFWSGSSISNDIRSQFVEALGTGSMRIGRSGSASDIGYLPPAGLRTRVPNIFLMECATGTRATNLIPNATIGNRPDFTTTNAGIIDIRNTTGQWYFLFSQPYSVNIENTATYDALNLSECASVFNFNNIAVGQYAGQNLPALTLTSNIAGGVVNNWNGSRGNTATSNGHNISVANSLNIYFKNVKSGIVHYPRSTGESYNLSQCSNTYFNNCTNINGTLAVVTSKNTYVYDHDHCDRYSGSTNATTGKSALTLSGFSDTTLLNGLTFGLSSSIVNNHPYNSIVTITNCLNTKVFNLGTFTGMLPGGSTNSTNGLLTDSGNNLNIEMKRCYVQPVRTGLVTTTNSTKNVLLENCFGDYNDTITPTAINMNLKGVSGTNTVTGQASVYGTHIYQTMTSSLGGRIVCAFNEPTTDTLPYATYLFSGSGGFTSAGNLALTITGSYFQYETPFYIYQVTSFRNSAPTLTGTNTGNHLFEYQLLTGSNWNQWKTLNGANLSSEVVNPDSGFKLKLRVGCTTTSTTNLLTFASFNFNTTPTALTGSLYPLINVPINVTVLDAVSKLPISGSRVYLKTSTNQEVFNTLTDVNGEVSTTYDYTSDISVTGKVRKSTSGSLYRNSDIVGSITSLGLDQTILMISDS